MSLQEVQNAWIYLDSNTMIWRGPIQAAQGVFQPIHWVAQSRMQAELRLAPNEGRIADIGCGYGIVTANLAWKKPRTEVIGIDPDEGRLQVGTQLVAEHKLRNCTFRKGTLEESGVEPNSCTGVICTEVLDHLPDGKEKLQERIAKLMEFLQPGGRLLVSFLDPEGFDYIGNKPPSPLRMEDFAFAKDKVLERNCPRWWYLFYIDKR
ncbi:MAG: hypothetical protein AMXMBFR7_35770 [Planctomycetota bacterium]